MRTRYLFIITTLLHGLITAQNYIGDPAEIDKILSNITAFSQSLMDSKYEAIANAYTSDGKLFPNNNDIISGRQAILDYWTPSNGANTFYHKISPEEIKILGEEAYDYGYYEGKTKLPNGDMSAWRGKYVIIWRKENDNWKIYLDIWNRIKD
ncbi:MAG: nuclear transport factor 2 family protein [Flavobacteriaceae bacterium]|nr:nuclear transport factor 2 family protein [Bacteroidia bacterium]NNF75295.1 nuclear transport factor 2 family protein [Flavobacteriaceae bacterium]